MLWTLWRSISVEFWRLLLLTTAVLVATIAFAITIKPLADGKLSPDQALRFMFYAIPPMLAYATPFAAGFAATIAIHRMSSENEVTAVYASGVSHKKFLVPSLVAGIILGGAVFALNDQVIPRFLREMERMVTQDFAKIFVGSLQSGESARIGSNEIHADKVQRIEPERGSPVTDQYALYGVAIVKADEQGVVSIDGTAKRAWIQVRPVWSLNAEDQARIGNDDATAVLMKFIDLTIDRDGSPITVDPFTLPAFPIPRVFKDDPKFMTGAEMVALKSDPDQMNFVDHKRINLAKGIASIEVFRDIKQRANRGESIELTSPAGQRVTILAGGFSSSNETWTLLPDRVTNTIEILIADSSGRVDRIRAEQATLSPERARTNDPLQTPATNTPTLTFSLDLEGVSILSDDETSTQQSSTQYTGLRFDSDPLEELLTHPSADLLGVAEPYINESSAQYAEFLVKPTERLRLQIEDLQREILSKQHERWAMAMASFVMVLAGSVIALRLRDAQALVVYMWSFFPALGTIVVIAGGQSAVHEKGAPALPFIYIGVLGLLIYTLIAYRKLARH
ncbi:MAG: LptF/LptG family permease [Phycisphaerales bacterium]|nr:LptF/LptG family permease [Phycisphaerales bacterium]